MPAEASEIAIRAKMLSSSRVNRCGAIDVTQLVVEGLYLSNWLVFINCSNLPFDRSNETHWIDLWF